MYFESETSPALTDDHAIRERILTYNEDDCIATRVLLDGLKAM